MIVVTQCPASKQPDAGYFRTEDGKRVLFVADPVRAPARSYLLYARPDDHADDGVSWRKRVAHYNATSDVNPFGLSRAYELFGIDNTMILSAGRGRRSVTMSCYPYHRRS